LIYISLGGGRINRTLSFSILLFCIIALISISGTYATTSNTQTTTTLTNTHQAAGTSTTTKTKDLIVTHNTISKTGVTSGKIIVSNTVKNQGNNAINQPFYVSYWLTSPTNLNKKLWIGARKINNLAAGASNHQYTTLRLPTYVKPGTYYTLTIADSVKQITETKENNNAKYSTYPTKIITSFTLKQIAETATGVKNHVEIYKALPKWASVGGIRINIAQFLYLATTATSQINKNNSKQATKNDSKILLKSNSIPSNPSEQLKAGKITMAEYVDFALRISDYMNTNHQAPPYGFIGLGQVGYQSQIYFYSRILNYYQIKGALPATASIKPWISVIPAASLLDAIGKAEAKFLDIQGQSYPNVMEKVGYGDCFADSLWLYNKFRTAGIGARILGSGWHRWVEYNLGSGWTEFPGYLNSGRKWGGHHYGSGGYSGRKIFVCTPSPTPRAESLR
jgi:hypothetical protein